jgi:predicted glycosyltransferase
MMRLSVFFYVQHLLGIGHLARASRIAAALAQDGFDVTVVMGGPPISGFPGAAINTIALPPVTSGEGFSALVDLQGNPVDDAFKQRRLGRLLQAYRNSRPDIVVIEAFPFGRRQMRFELLPLLEAIRATSPKPLLVTSIRDILQEHAKPGRNEETIDLLNRHFDLVMVHGDPSFAKLEQTFPLARSIDTEIAYTGLVAAPPPDTAAQHCDVLVSAGGGAAGANLVRSTVAAAKMFDESLNWCLITGPNLPQAEFDAAVAEAPPGLSVFRFRPDFASLLTGAAVSVSQAGYNTVCDVLRAGCRALLIPFAEGGETEQTARALRLEKLGLATVLFEQDLTARGLAAAIARTASAVQRPAHGLDLDGAQRSAQILRDRWNSSFP